MPFKHVIDHQRGYMETTVTGPVNWDALQAHWEAELADGGETYPELIDGTAATVEFTAEEVRRLVSILQASAKTRALGPTAIVVSTDVAFGMVRMMGIHLEPFCHVRPFRDRASAEQWLSAFIVPPGTSST
jgi:hypothetical protein